MPTTAGTYTYVLSCGNEGQSSSQSATVEVTSAVAGPDITLIPTTQTIQAGTSGAHFTWVSATAVQCTTSGNDPQWSGSKPTLGSFDPALGSAGTYLYTLSCSNAQGWLNTASAIVPATQAGPSLTLNFAPQKIKIGESSALTWTASGATQCTASGGDPKWVTTTP